MDYKKMWDELKEQIVNEYTFQKENGVDEWDKGHMSGLRSVFVKMERLENGQK